MRKEVKMKNIISYTTIIILFIVSLGINIYLMKGEGIHVHNDNRVDHRVWNNQSQSQIMMNMQMLQGRPELCVKCKAITGLEPDIETIQESFINEVFGDKSLINFHLSKIYYNRFRICIAYYEIYPEEWKIRKK